VPLLPTSITRHRTPGRDRLARYTLTSIIVTVFSLTLLALLVGGFALPAVPANIFATILAAALSFELSRRYVWRHQGPRRTAQLTTFFSVAATGLVLSTLAVGLASALTIHSSHLVHTVAVLVANFATYGLIWVGRYQVSHRLIFKPIPEPTPEENATLE